MRFYTTVKIALILAGTIGCGGAMAETQVPAEMKSQARALAKMCKSDARRYCASIKPGEGRVLAGLQERQANLTEDCRMALAKAQEMRVKAAAAGTLPQ
jgi:hypothetical protein